jgi:glycerate-2-kinase
MMLCLISGGEFGCPIRGSGTGGRSSETVLRCTIEIDDHVAREMSDLGFSRMSVLSAGTDGVDGNSTVAGAVADEATNERARVLGVDAHRSLEQSDSHTFFESLGDTIITGPTGTNVRDVRIVLAGRAAC